MEENFWSHENRENIYKVILCMWVYNSDDLQ